MIDEKKLTRYIKTEINPYGKPFDGTVFEFGNMLIDYMERMEKEPERKWIPVSERLPDELVAVNVTWINRCPQNYYMHIKDKPFTDTAVLYRGKWYWWYNTIIDYLSEYGACIFEAVDKSIDILAWQPLPEPFEGSKEE